MKQLNLPFKIDRQHENWQFELDAVDDRLEGYHSYIYIGKKLNYFLNLITHRTELIFNADYLTAVIIKIKYSNKEQFDSINQFLVINSSKNIIIDEFNRKYKIWRIVYLTTYIPKRKQIIIIYGKPRFIKKHLLLLQSN
ncbi:hypothetical protein ACFO3U_03140 [Flavobacterium ponti]|uniref:Uncharacterized protein n=1 Tax=Flavobacterium ponti TaxID=665133 RepID=A0ABV9P434_9FLAO